MQPRQVELLGGLRLGRADRSFRRVRNRLDIIGFAVPVEQLPPAGNYVEGEFPELASFRGNCLVKQTLRSDFHVFPIVYVAVLVFQNHCNILFRSSEYLKVNLVSVGWADVHKKILARVFHYAQFPVREEILHESLLLVWLEPCEVRLILGVDTCHQLDVRAVLIGKIPVPCPSKVSVSPGPLLLSRGNVMVRDVKHACAGVIFISSDEIVFRIHCHI